MRCVRDDDGGNRSSDSRRSGSRAARLWRRYGYWYWGGGMAGSGEIGEDTTMTGEARTGCVRRPVVTKPPLFSGPADLTCQALWSASSGVWGSWARWRLGKQWKVGLVRIYLLAPTLG